MALQGGGEEGVVVAASGICPASILQGAQSVRGSACLPVLF